MKTRKHKNNKLFAFNVLRIDFGPPPENLKVLPNERTVVKLGRHQAVGSCWPSVKNGLLFGTDRQYEFHNVVTIN